MKGLLIKDCKLIFGNVKMFVMLGVISVFLLCTTGAEVYSFVVSYLTVIAAMFVLSTISYDDFDHGMTFLMTLPITRKIYVLEKYVFSILCALAGFFVSLIICGAYDVVTGTSSFNTEFILGCTLVVAALIMMLAVMIPVQLKFGGDNGKIVLIIVIIGFVAVSTLLKKILENNGINIETVLDNALTGLINHIIPITILASVFLLVVSFLISCRVMDKKVL